MKALAVFLFFLVVSPHVYSDIVVPKSTVTSYVTVRASNASGSDKIGELRPGDSLEYVSSVSRWHKIKLIDGRNGFVSKRWTDVEEDQSPYFDPSKFTVHFIDVGVGDSAIIDMGEKEIIIDGGNYINDLHNYINQNNLVDGPIELVIVTHGDQDHWKGLSRLLGFDGNLDEPLGFNEYWDPGYNRDCNPPDAGGRVNYLNFVADVKDSVPANRFKRPLENFHTPMDQSGSVTSFSISSLPGVEFTVLHSDSRPTAASCSYSINNASIVLMIEIDGVKMMFTGDANGKERRGPSNAAASHVEKSLLDASQSIGGNILKADLLKVPHHGSETASTESFISAVDPKYVVISSATNHHLPKQTVLNRYINNERVILRTDLNRKRMTDHIVCGMTLGNKFDCQYSIDINDN